MDWKLYEALLNTAVILASAVGLWWFWRLERNRYPAALEPLAPPADPAELAATLAQRRRDSQEAAEAAERQLRRVAAAFSKGHLAARP